MSKFKKLLVLLMIVISVSSMFFSSASALVLLPTAIPQKTYDATDPAKNYLNSQPSSVIIYSDNTFYINGKKRVFRENVKYSISNNTNEYISFYSGNMCNLRKVINGVAINFYFQSDIRQSDWCICEKCGTLTYDGRGTCPAGGSHLVYTNHYVFTLEKGIRSGYAGSQQSNWRWCNKCQSLCFAGNGLGKCSDGGIHNFSGSFNYFLEHYAPSGLNNNTNLRWCYKCQCMFDSSKTTTVCPAGGKHDGSYSGKYSADTCYSEVPR